MSATRGAVPPETPRRLSREELADWMPIGGLLLTLPATFDAHLQRDAGLSHFEYLVLAGLSEAPGRTLRMSTLAQLANGSLSRLSHVVRRLERRGWVRRETCRSDGRFTNAVLTDAGRDKVGAGAPCHVAAVRALVLDVLVGDDLHRLAGIARRVLARIEQERRRRPDADPVS